MESRRAHVSATEARTLCGLRPSRTYAPELPWADWITLYQQNRKACCTKCRRALMQYSDRTRAIIAADIAHRERGAADL